MRRPPWQREGQEPDYRFSLANERTFLAWIRTALALLAGGIALDQFAMHLAPRALVIAVAIGLVVLAAVLFPMAYARWKAVEQAMRGARPLPAAAGIPLLAAALCLSAIALALLLLPLPLPR
jgi:putative membrane protein